MRRVSGLANRDGQACLQLNPGRGLGDQSNSWDQMAKLIGEMLFGLVRLFIEDWLKRAALKVCAWLDTKIQGRTTKIIVGALLGLAAYFVFPIILGLF
jgi:hypothetical protein